MNGECICKLYELDCEERIGTISIEFSDSCDFYVEIEKEVPQICGTRRCKTLFTVANYLHVRKESADSLVSSS